MLTDLRRARPYLGTVVEIVVPSVIIGQLQIDRAFAAIEKVQRLMSAHDPSSDLGRLFTAAPGTSLSVNPWTWRVLATAQKIYQLTAGVFDPVVAARIALERGDLPVWPGKSPARSSDFSDVTLLPEHRVCFARRLRIDLGGIAKGFAVDQAIHALKRAGAAEGLVNAGGDMRAFGPRRWPVHLRDPGSPEQFFLHTLCEGAIATSAPYFSERMTNDRMTSALIDARTGKFVTGAISVSVFAPTCLVADAVTKAVFCKAAPTVLRACRARALVLQKNGEAAHAA